MGKSRQKQEVKKPIVAKDEQEVKGESPVSEKSKQASQEQKRTQMSSNETNMVAQGEIKKQRNRKIYKPVHLLVPIVLVITIAVLAVCAEQVLSTFRESGAPLIQNGEDIEWINFVGMSEQEAKELLEADPYKQLVKEYVYEYDPDVDTMGKVIAQKPSPKTIKSTQKVVITINQGAQDILIPDVAGKTREEAKEILKAAGIVPYFKTVYDTNGTIGNVVSTEPSAGQTVKSSPEENKVVVNIAGVKIGEETVKVPSFIGLSSVREAQALATDNSIDLVVDYIEASTPAEIGQIISQSPKSGSSIKVFSSVTIVVAVDPASLEEETSDTAAADIAPAATPTTTPASEAAPVAKSVLGH